MKRNLISSVVLAALALSAGAAMAAEEGPIRRARRVELPTTRISVGTSVAAPMAGIRERTAVPGLSREAGITPINAIESLVVPPARPAEGGTVVQRGIGISRTDVTAEIDSTRDTSRRAGFHVQASKLSDLGEMAGLDPRRANSERRANFRLIKVTAGADLEAR